MDHLFASLSFQLNIWGGGGGGKFSQFGGNFSQ